MHASRRGHLPGVRAHLAHECASPPPDPGLAGVSPCTFPVITGSGHGGTIGANTSLTAARLRDTNTRARAAP